MALLLSPLRDSDPHPDRAPDGPGTACITHRTVLMTVADSKALGYANNTKFVIDAAGTASFAVRSKDRGGRFNIALGRWQGPCSEALSVVPTWLQDRDGLEVTTAPQRPAAIAAAGDGSIDMVWYGGSGASPDHQIHFARFAAGASAEIREESTPFTVAGFAAAWAGGPVGKEMLWQEHAALAVGEDGTTHVVWEARDANRKSKDGAPKPGVAYATRNPAGAWSVNGVIDQPPYLEVDDRYASQSRPTVLVDRAGTVHVLCYGAVGSLQQILYGEVRNHQFSGWKPVAPSSHDQRHVAAALDAMGRLHVVWREGSVRDGAAAGPVSVCYCMRNANGSWQHALYVSDPNDNASTPTIAATNTGVCVAWIAWTPGAMNSEGQPDNGFPGDNSTVEGRLKTACKQFDAASFDAAAVVDDGTAAYPCWAVQSAASEDPPPLLWTSPGSGDAAGGQCKLWLGWYTRPSR